MARCTSKDLDDFLLVGELGLDGTLRAVQGMLPIAVAARAKGITNLIIPASNAREAAVVQGVKVYPVKTLLEVRELLNSAALGAMTATPLEVKATDLLNELQHFSHDFKDVRGQHVAKRALEGGCSGRAQYSDDRAAGFGQNDAGEAAAVDSGSAAV